MDKKARWTTAVIIILIALGVAYVYLQKDTPIKNNEQSQQNAVEDPAPSNNQTTSPTVRGTYIAYSPDAVSSAKGDKILFFHAPWCPQCREIEKTINNSSLPDNLTLFKVDYDSNQKLRQQYGVTLQTTFVKIDKDGNKIESYVAYNEPTFEAVKRELLP